MADYSYLSAAEVTSETLAEYVFRDIPGEPSIWLAAARDENIEYLSYRLQLQMEEADATPTRKASDQPSASEVAADQDSARENDRKLIARACARKWGVAPLAADGTQPDFSEENCLAFFRAMPGWMFDPLRNFVVNVRNFAPKMTLPANPDALGNE